MIRLLRRIGIRLRRRHQRGALAGVQVAIVGLIIATAMGAVSATVYLVEQAMRPDYAHDAAEELAATTARHIEAVARFESNAVQAFDAGGTVTWTKSMVVQGATTTATVSFKPNGKVGWIDVTVPDATTGSKASARTSVDLTQRAIAPGTILPGAETP